MKNLGTVTKNDEDALLSYREQNKLHSNREITPRTTANQKQIDYQDKKPNKLIHAQYPANMNLHEMIKSYLKVTPQNR